MRVISKFLGSGLPLAAIFSLPEDALRQFVGSAETAETHSAQYTLAPQYQAFLQLLYDPTEQRTSQFEELQKAYNGSTTSFETNINESLLFTKNYNISDNLVGRVYDGGSRFNNAPTPLLVYVHGGSWTSDRSSAHESLLGAIAQESGVPVLSVNVASPPSISFSASVDKLLTAWDWALNHTTMLNIDPTRVAIGGDSLGGSIALAASMYLCAPDLTELGRWSNSLTANNHTVDRRVCPRHQFLLYPPTLGFQMTPSRRQFAEGYVLTLEDVFSFMESYCGSECNDNPLIAIVRATELEAFKTLPPTSISVAGFDVLRDEGIELATALQNSGVPTTLRVQSGLIHGYGNFLSIDKAAQRAVSEASSDLAEALES